MSSAPDAKEQQALRPESRPALTDNVLEGTHTSIVLRTKLKIALNAVRHIRKHVYVHLFSGIGMTLFLVGGGTGLFYMIFRFLMNQEVFGAPLMDRLIGVVFLIFFVMLLFSNLIITLSTTYISREIDFLMGLPISRQSIFRQKLIESIFYSSWAFALLSLPLFVSLGISRDVPWYYYPLALGLIVPFLTIPATLGAIVTMVVTAIFPARQTRILCLALGALSIVGTIVLARVSGLGRLLATAKEQDFLQIMNALSLGNSPLLPSAWLANALYAIAPADPRDVNPGMYLYWLGMMVATALFLLEVCRWMVPVLYYRGWCLSRDAAHKEVDTHARLSPFRAIDGLLDRVFKAPVAGLLSKDLKTFWRDPSQWTQLVILFGLMVIYVINLGWSTRYSDTIQLVVSDWRILLSYFNLAATCFILSILTTRFVYPMLSLEGRGFWTVGLAPIPRSSIVWQKFALCLMLCLAVSLPLTFLSGYILQVRTGFIWLSAGMITMMSLGLTSLSIGIGAILPDFREDNPARIANGIGGTLNVLVSLIYISLSVLLLALPAVLLEGGEAGQRFFARIFFPYILVMGGMQLAAVIVPLRLGLRRWNRLEF